MRKTTWIVAAILGVGAPGRTAYACGGFFCSTAPVEQAGETIVYGIEADGTLTMSVQIEYRGEDDDFAWILPVPAPPEITLGTDALFTGLRSATEPLFVTNSRTTGTCREHPRCVTGDGCMTVYDSGDCGGGGGARSTWSGEYIDAGERYAVDAARDADAIGPGVTIFSETVVGPYDTVVIGAATTAEVLDWLGTHGYIIPQETASLVDAYSTGGQIFVALRLATNRLTSTIRPVVLRMPTSEACLPIRLTPIATVPDLPITAFFLGSARAVPLNYSSAEIDVGDPAFWTGTRRWSAAAAQAVNDMGGQAFVTDYSGPTPALSLELGMVSDLATETDPALFVQSLQARGYAGDPVVFELFSRYLVPPVGEDARSYYNCLASDPTVVCGAPETFDPARLAAAIEAEITVPRRDAEALVRRHGHLTRLYTSMRAENMTIDPIFIEDAGQPDVSNLHYATLVKACSYEHFEEHAPTHWQIGTETFPESDGYLSSDSAYCSALGGVPEADAPMCEEMTTTTTDSGWCAVSGAGTVQGGLLALAFVLIVLRRRRHS